MGYPDTKSTRFETAQEAYFCELKGFFNKPYTNLEIVLGGSPTPSLLPRSKTSGKNIPEMKDFDRQKVGLKSHN